jgi:hypothetical protein
MPAGKGIQRFFMAAAAVSTVGMLSGFGLGRYATGGATVQMIEHDDGYAALGRPESLVADNHGVTDNGITQVVPISCVGCGPSLAERQAMAQDRAVEAALAREQARLDAQMRAVAWQPYTTEPTPAADETLTAADRASPAVRPLEGSSALLIEAPT